ncbi:MAG: NAD-dependent epimerase/dehydratase family protein, partial [Planctomycetes bacterium]|nr:NAD-dependent epimerase/dehydratase family protein [Planctomycetota bacterium]
LKLAMDEGRSHGQPVKFMFPSSIAVYGLPDLAAKAAAGAVTETEWTTPRTMYGCNKLYCEQLGRYYADFYRQLAVNEARGQVDFRAIRFPGLISAFTVPSGGTSDYVPEMLHAAAKGEPYACFVRPDTRITFMAMPDAIDALLKLTRAPAEKLSRRVYNIGAFNPSAGEFADLVRRHFPGAEIGFAPHEQRQAIVDSWPADVVDRAAREDWGHEPAYDLERAMTEYLIPNISKRYA